VISRGVINTPSQLPIRGIIDFSKERDIDIILLRRELREKDELLNMRKTYKKGKRVILKGQIIVSRDSIIRKVERIDKEAKEKREEKDKEKKKIMVLSSDSEEEESDNELA
jgi:hypothetical protein